MLASLGWPAELLRYHQERQDSGEQPHIMEQNTRMYTDCTVAAAFGKWPHEFYHLHPQEQELLRWFIALRAEKESFAYRSRKDRLHWPFPPPDEHE